MKKKDLFILILFVTNSIIFNSCTEENAITTFMPNEYSSKTRALPTPAFDWENADWMPTPSGQSRIPSPWVGSGSLTSMYGIETINDRRASDGWELLYNSFDSNSSGNLVNPYFILYNKYRGIMRIFFYTTTQFLTTSAYLQDGLSVISNTETSILNFLGESIIDCSNKKLNYQQMQPILNGIPPVNSNKWYMMEYELAYDPNLINIPYNNIQLRWNLNYHDVSQFSFGGNIEGSLKAIMGSSTRNNIISAAGNLGTKVGTGVIAGIGQNILVNNTIDATTGENKLGLKNKLFKSLLSGVDKAVSGAAGGIPGAVASLLSAVIGGSGEQKAVSYNLEANIKLTGTGTSIGSFPSSPISFWVPGTNITQNAVGYIPMYNKLLGVINFNGTPTLNTTTKVTTYWSEVNGQWENVFSERRIEFPRSINYSQYLMINPEVLNIANVSIKSQDIVALEYLCGQFCEYHINPYYVESRSNYPSGFKYGVRFTIEVKPKNGAPASTIIKTFLLHENPTYIEDDIYGRF